MTVIFDVRHTQTLDYIRISLVVLLDPENMGIAVGMSLLSSIQAEIYKLPLYFQLINPLTATVAKTQHQLWILFALECIVTKSWR